MREFTEPAAAVIKHTNPCGAATGSSAADAYVRAREADRLSSFGGIVGLNRPIDVDTARAIVSTKIDAVFSPAIEADAVSILATRPDMRVVVPVVAPSDDEVRAHIDPGRDVELRSILGGVLVQVRDRADGSRESVDGRHRCRERGAARRHASSADGRGVAGTAVRVAGLRACEIEHRDLHVGRSYARYRRRPG